MRVAAGLGAHDRDAHLREQVPVRVEVARRGVEELEPGEVRRAAAVADDGGVERAAERVGGQQVLALVAHERDTVGDRGQRPLQARPGRRRPGRAAAWPARRGDAVGGAGQVEQVRALGVVELERPRDGVEHRRRRPADRTALELGVVLHAHARRGSRPRCAAGPGTRRLVPPRTPAASGVTFARRDMRNSRTSARLSMLPTVGRAAPTRESVRRGALRVHPSAGTPHLAPRPVAWWAHPHREAPPPCAQSSCTPRATSGSTRPSGRRSSSRPTPSSSSRPPASAGPTCGRTAAPTPSTTSRWATSTWASSRRSAPRSRTCRSATSSSGRSSPPTTRATSAWPATRPTACTVSPARSPARRRSTPASRWPTAPSSRRPACPTPT